MSRVLDRDALDAAATRMLGGVRVDAAGVAALAAGRARRTRRRRRVAGAGLLVAAAAAVLLLVGNAVPGVALPRPAPAERPAGPGQVPDVVRVPPPWTPSATERPLSRVAYAVLDTRHDAPGGSGRPVWLVGADREGYRSLPAEAPQRVAVSADGSRVSWVEEPQAPGRSPAHEADVVRILDVRAGEVRSVPLPGVFDRGFAVAGAAFAPTGARLLVWGSDRGPDPGDRRETVRGFRIDAAAARPVAEPVLGASPLPPGGFALQADGRPATGRAAPAPVNDGDEDGGLPQGSITQPPLVAPGGDPQYAVVGEELTRPGDRGRELFRYRLELRWAGPVAGAQVADLGTGTAALGLGVGGVGGPVLVSRWTTAEVSESGGTGPGEVLRVAGQVRTLSRSEGSARVIAAAATLVVAAGTAAAPAEPARLTQATWYGWQARRGAAWTADLPWWVLAAAGAGACGLVLGLARRGGHRARVRTATGVVATGVAVAVAGSAVVLVAGAALDVAGADRTAAAGGSPVLPAVLSDRHRAAPRAFDAAGEPGTRRVSAVFRATVAGREGAYALDAATGRTVSLAGLPGVEPAGDDVDWTVSPDGRYLASEAGVVDLETARVTKLSVELHHLMVDYNGVVAGVTDDGWVLHTGADGRRYTLPNQEQAPAEAVVAQFAGNLLVRARPVGGGAARYHVVDRAAGVVTPAAGLTGSETYPPSFRPDGRVLTGDLGRSVRVLAAAPVAGSGQGFAAVGPDGDRRVAILRALYPGSVWEPLTTVRLDVTDVVLAPDVILAAHTTDDVAEPWWAAVADPDARDVAARALAAGLAALLALGVVLALTRRPRPFAETVAFRDLLRGDAARGRAG